MIETDSWNFIGAKHFTKTAGKRTVRVIVIHSMESSETTKTAENVARYFATTNVKASAHLCIDSDSIVQCVLDNDVAWAAPGCNGDGLQVELAGRAAQTSAEWLDPFGVKMLDLAANAVAQYCLKYNLPVKHLSNEELKRGERGIVGHAQVSRVYRKSTHTDPGDGFPYLYFIERVKHFYEERKQRLGVQ